MDNDIATRLERLERILERDLKHRSRKKRKKDRSRSRSSRRRHHSRDHWNGSDSPVERDPTPPPPPPPSEPETHDLELEDEVPGSAQEASGAARSPTTKTTAVSTAETPDEELDSTIRDILGADPMQATSYASEIQKDLAVRLEHTSTTGLTKETRKELREKYLLPSNCKLIDAPMLNPEIKAAVSDVTLKRDKAIEHKQKQIACAIACLGQAITRAIPSKDSTLLKLLMDAGRLMCDVQYSDSVTRKNFIISSVKKEMKEQLDSTKTDNLLFGKDLADTLKTAKAINKSGEDLKVTSIIRPMAPKPKKQVQVPPKNWKGPHPARRQMGTSRTKGPASTRNPHPSSSGQSQRRPYHSSRR